MTRRLVFLLAVAAWPLIAAPPPAHAAGPLAASFTAYGPYGDALLLLPPASVVVTSQHAAPLRGEAAPAAAAMIVGEIVDGRATRDVAALSSPPLFAAAEIKDREDEKLPPPQPGTLRAGAVRVPALPGAELKSQLVTPHLTPDVEVIRSGRTTVGFFGEVGRVEVERSSVIPSVRAHGVGAGLTLQYKFGQ